MTPAQVEQSEPDLHTTPCHLSHAPLPDGTSDTSSIVDGVTAAEGTIACDCPGQQDHSPSWLQRRVHASIIWYQRAREGRPSPCRFFPSCSAYALEAVDVHGSWRGGWLAVRRLVRCRPLGPSGFDPVPEATSASPTCRCPSVPPLSDPTPLIPTSQKGG